MSARRINVPHGTETIILKAVGRANLRRIIACILSGIITLGFVLHASLKDPAGVQTQKEERLFSVHHEKGRLGSWGTLHWTQVELRPPHHYSRNDIPTNLPPWIFPSFSMDQLKALMEKAGVDASQKRKILQHSRREDEKNQLIVETTPELLLNLSMHSRSVIYSELAKYEENPDKLYAFHLTMEEYGAWLRTSNLQQSTQKLITDVAYKDEHLVYIADQPLLHGLIDDEEENRRLMSAFARTKSLIVSLQVDPDSDINQLTSYWGVGKRNKDVRPILESLAELKNGTEIDIAHLIPSFARMRLYTYPTAGGVAYDCHWSSLNFFNSVPDERFLHLEHNFEEINNQYSPVNLADARLGDIICFVRSNNVILHTSVYIADDIVFTKNGLSYQRPWVLMKLSDVVAKYPQAPVLLAMRHKKLYQDEE